jgi:hypothetical protein
MRRIISVLAVAAPSCKGPIFSGGGTTGGNGDKYSQAAQDGGVGDEEGQLVRSCNDNANPKGIGPEIALTFHTP